MPRSCSILELELSKHQGPEMGKCERLIPKVNGRLPAGKSVLLLIFLGSEKVQHGQLPQGMAWLALWGQCDPA